MTTADPADRLRGVLRESDASTPIGEQAAAAVRVRSGSEVFPFVLTTGRLYAHWHTLTRTAKADKLVRREPGPFVEVNAADA